MSLDLLLLGIEHLLRFLIHHDPTPGRDEGRRVIEVEVFHHALQIFIITYVVVGVLNISTILTVLKIC